MTMWMNKPLSNKNIKTSKVISSLFTNFQMKWHLVTIRLALLWKMQFLNMAIVIFLSQKFCVDSSYACNQIVNSILIPTSWHVINLVAIYYFCNELITMDFFDADKTTPITKWKPYTHPIDNITYNIIVTISNQIKPLVVDHKISYLIIIDTYLYPLCNILMRLFRRVHKY